MWSISAIHPTTVPHSCWQSLLGAIATVGTTRGRKIFPRFFGNLYSSAWTLHQDHRSLSSPPVQKISSIRFLTLLHALPLSLTCRRLRARDSFFSRWTSPPESPVVDLLAYLPGFLLQHLNLHFFLCFVSDHYTFLGFLDF